MTCENMPACKSAEVPYLERVRYFSRQLITADDLFQEQEYFRNKLRRHNRLLHGWGVVCGARVRKGSEVGEVIIEPGYILGPFGDEIVIDCEVTTNLCKDEPECIEGIDPWCSDVRVERQGGLVYLAVRYMECNTRPVRVHTGECGCDEFSCEYSRIRDSFEVKAFSKLPPAYEPMPKPILRLGRGYCNEPCPPCPTDPWVVLADITLGSNCTINSIDCFRHRRYVATFAEYYTLCGGKNLKFPGLFSKTSESLQFLIDVQSEGTGTEPVEKVPIRRTDDSWGFLPIYFAVEAGDTFGILLEREGDREFYDPANGETYTLRELYTLAEVNPQAPIEKVSEAVTPLEGQQLRVSDYRVVRTGLEKLIEPHGIERLDRENIGAPKAAPELPAVDLKGLDPTSPVREKLEDKKIIDVAGMSRKDFVKMALHNLQGRKREIAENEANEIWTTANRVVKLSRAWDESG